MNKKFKIAYMLNYYNYWKYKNHKQNADPKHCNSVTNVTLKSVLAFTVHDFCEKNIIRSK